MTTSCISSPEEEEKAKDIALSAVDSDKADVDDTQETEKPKKVPSKDSPLRWASLVVYLAITTPLLLATIVLVAALDNWAKSTTSEHSENL